LIFRPSGNVYPSRDDVMMGDDARAVSRCRDGNSDDVRAIHDVDSW